MKYESVPILVSPEGERIVREQCEKHKFPKTVFKNLVEAELAQAGKQKKRGLHDLFDDAFEEHIQAQGGGTDVD